MILKKEGVSYDTAKRKGTRMSKENYDTTNRPVKSIHQPDQAEIEFNEMIIKCAECFVDISRQIKRRMIELGEDTEERLQEIDDLIERCEDFHTQVTAKEKN